MRALRDSSGFYQITGRAAMRRSRASPRRQQYSFLLGRADTKNLTRRREGREYAIIALVFPVFYPVILALYPVIPALYSRHSRSLPRHSRESGNPDDCSQDRRPKSSANSNQRIPSPFMGLQGQALIFGVLVDTGTSGTRGKANQVSHPKSSTNCSQRIPSPFMGLPGQALNFGVSADARI